MCGCGGTKTREVWTSAQAEAEAARREADALTAAGQEQQSTENALMNAGT